MATSGLDWGLADKYNKGVISPKGNNTSVGEVDNIQLSNIAAPTIAYPFNNSHEQLLSNLNKPINFKPLDGWDSKIFGSQGAIDYNNQILMDRIKTARAAGLSDAQIGNSDFIKNANTEFNNMDMTGANNGYLQQAKTGLGNLNWSTVNDIGNLALGYQSMKASKRYMNKSIDLANKNYQLAKDQYDDQKQFKSDLSSWGSNFGITSKQQADAKEQQ